jgi:penicillin-binding protein 1A
MSERKLVKVKKAGFLAKFALATIKLGLLAALIGGVWGYFEYQEKIINNPGAHLSRDHIRSVIVQESPVYYRDGTTRIGVFFEDEHRQYVGWDTLPKAYVMAIVASEDGDFWSHFGVSPKHITRAMWQNITAGRLVAGGSTLTQQTAKNIYYRPDRSLKSKLGELYNALRLEAHYEKHEILTFYVNQFHVSGNGRGLGIASRYFFDKQVENLSVLESAFLAGLVKAPSYYDPFIGTAERRARSLQRAHDRTRYVLGRLIKENGKKLTWPQTDEGSSDAEISAEISRVKTEAQRLLTEGFELDFHRGTFRYEASATLDEVARRLTQPPFVQLMRDAEIEDPATAGLKIITTLDQDAQREAQYGLWHHLTELGARLEGYGAEHYVMDGRGPAYEPKRILKPHEFRRATVVEHVVDNGRTHLNVDVGGRSCVVDRAGVVRVAVESKRGKTKDRTEKVNTAEANEFVTAIKDDDVVLVSVREVDDEGAALCDLESRPTLQGALALVRNGELHAMVGGNDNLNFNRVTAKRQMGSAWKPLLLSTALERGWKATDMLDNHRAVFPFSGTFYYPNPDHKSENIVSLGWAGVRSENLASIWLLYHLLDKSPASELLALAAKYGLLQRDGEAGEDYRLRIQRAGVLPQNSRRQESSWLEARADVLQRGSMSERDRVGLMSLNFGTGFSAERQRVQKGANRGRSHKLKALDHNWRGIREMEASCREQWTVFARAVASNGLPDKSVELLFVTDGGDGAAQALTCGLAQDDQVSAMSWLQGRLQREGSGRLQSLLDGLIGQILDTDDELVPPVEEVLLLGRVSIGAISALQTTLDRIRLLEETEPRDLYSPEALIWHPDFRILLSMKSVIEVAENYGVRTEIQEVLSMPLGASEVTLEEMTVLYEGLVSGEHWTFPSRLNIPGKVSQMEAPATDRPTLLISEIRNVDGDLLYQAEPTVNTVATDATPAVVRGILSNVVVYGTGRRAANAVVSGGAIVPLGGKTGTTNSYRNAVFMGFVPIATDVGYTITDGYTLGVYVGYDDNRKMARGNLRVSGSTGALPAWMLTAQGLNARGLLGAPEEVADERVWPLVLDASLRVALVNKESGLTEEPTQEAQPMLFYRPEAGESSESWFDLFDPLGGSDEEPRPIRAVP